MLGKLVYFLFRNYHCVAEVQAGEVNVLEVVVVLVDLVEDLPGHVEFDPLPHHFHLVSVLVLEVYALLELH